MRYIIFILLSLVLLSGCATSKKSYYPSSKPQEITFIGSTCPYCGYKINSIKIPRDKEVMCPSCNTFYLVNHGRQIYYEQNYAREQKEHNEYMNQLLTLYTAEQMSKH